MTSTRSVSYTHLDVYKRQEEPNVTVKRWMNVMPLKTNSLKASIRLSLIHIYALYLADAIKDSGLPREEFKLKVGAFGAEPWTESMRRDIERCV